MTLRNVYGVPRKNIKVLMADGTDPTADMKLEGNESLYISSPLDLDDDGIDDIEYSATKDNLKKVFADLSNMVTSNDHLLVFVIDHGSINSAGISQICLWGDSISAPELSDMVKPIDAGYITFVLGQCYAGGFEKYLRADNRLILSACRENEMSFGRPEGLYDEFVYQFTSALAGYTPYDEPFEFLLYSNPKDSEPERGFVCFCLKNKLPLNSYIFQSFNFNTASAILSSSSYHSSPKRLVSGPFRNLYIGRPISFPFLMASRHTSQRW